MLNYAILTELLLADFIREYFFKEKIKATEFSNFILNKEFFTFEQKIQVFSKLLENYGDLKLTDSHLKEFHVSENQKDLIKKIRYVQKIRNILAHNHPFTKESGEPYVEYFSQNKTKELILNEAFDKEFFDNYFNVSWILRELVNAVKAESSN